MPMTTLSLVIGRNLRNLSRSPCPNGNSFRTQSILPSHFILHSSSLHPLFALTPSSFHPHSIFFSSSLHPPPPHSHQNPPRQPSWHTSHLNLPPFIPLRNLRLMRSILYSEAIFQQQQQHLPLNHSSLSGSSFRFIHPISLLCLFLVLYLVLSFAFHAPIIEILLRSFRLFLRSLLSLFPSFSFLFFLWQLLLLFSLSNHYSFGFVVVNDIFVLDEHLQCLIYCGVSKN